MEKEYPIIAFLREQKMLDESTLERVVDEHEQTGQSLINILRRENLLEEEQLSRAVAGANKIEFVNLSPEMVDPMLAHLVSYEVANRYNLIPIKICIVKHNLVKIFRLQCIRLEK